MPVSFVESFLNLTKPNAWNCSKYAIKEVWQFCIILIPADLFKKKTLLSLPVVLFCEEQLKIFL